MSAGGLLVTLAESALRGGHGARVTLDAALPAHQALFSESPSRVVVATGDLQGLLRRCAERGVPAALLGTVTAERRLDFGDALNLDLEELAAGWESALPSALAFG